MNFEELKRAINIRETIKLYFVAIGRYKDFIRSYARNKDGSWVNPSLHDSTAAQHEPIIVQSYRGSLRDEVKPKFPLMTKRSVRMWVICVTRLHSIKFASTTFVGKSTLRHKTSIIWEIILLSTLGLEQKIWTMAGRMKT